MLRRRPETPACKVERMIRIGYHGPPHPLFGFVAMLEDEDYEVTYEPPDLSSQDPVEVELLVTDIQLKGSNGVEAAIQEFKHRHPELPIAIRVKPPPDGNHKDH
jgi:hypothetical protein